MTNFYRDLFIFLCNITLCISYAFCTPKPTTLPQHHYTQDLPLHKVWHYSKSTPVQLKQSLIYYVKALQKKRQSQSFWTQLSSYISIKNLCYTYPFLREYLSKPQSQWLATHAITGKAHHPSQHWLWTQYQIALQSRKDKKAQTLTRQLGWLRDAYFSTESISAKDPLHAKDWHKNPTLFDQVGMTDTQFIKSDHGVYFLWHLHFTKQQHINIHVTHSHDVKAWLNKEILQQLPGQQILTLDQNTWSVHVRKGYNRFIVHIADPEAQLLIRLSNQRGKFMSNQTLQTFRTQWGVSPDAVELLNPTSPKTLWQKQATQRTQVVDRWSDDDLLGMAYYAKEYHLSDQDRVWLSIEIDRRWQKNKNWILAQALSALTPSRLRKQLWDHYNISNLKYQTKQDHIIHAQLLVTQIEDAMIDHRLHQAGKLLAQLIDLPYYGVEQMLMWVQWLDTLDLSKTSHTLLAELYQNWFFSPHIYFNYVHSLWKQGLVEQALCTFMKGYPKLKLSDEHTHLRESLIVLWRMMLVDKPYTQTKKSVCVTRINSFTQQLESWIMWGVKGFSYIVNDLENAFDTQDSLRFKSLLKHPSLDQHWTAKHFEARWNQRNQNDQDQYKIQNPPYIQKALGISIDQIFQNLEQNPPINHPSGAHVIKKYVYIDFDQQGRLVRQQRNLIYITHPQAARDWQSVHVLYQPQSQDLTIKNAHIYRKINDQWIKISSQSIHQESISEENFRLYYDVQKYSVSFHDLQQGDLIEWEWNLHQKDNDVQLIIPYAEMIPLQQKNPIHELQIQLGPQASKRIHTHIAHPVYLKSEWLTANQRASTWTWYHIPAWHLEAHSSPGSSSIPYMHVSTFRQWSSVRDLYATMLVSYIDTHESLKKQALTWTQNTKDPEDKIRALYQAITRNIRYVGLEFGQHSFRPAMPQQTLIRGFGDCKDRAVLLISLAKTLGIELQFVMVRTANAGLLDQQGVAGLNAFNHALVYSPTLKRFLDPTVSHHDVWTLPIADQGAHSIVISLHEQKTNTQVLSMIPYALPEQEAKNYTLDITQWPHIKADINYTGRWAVQVRALQESHQTIESWVYKTFDLLDLSVHQIHATGIKPVIDPIQITLNAEAQVKHWDSYVRDSWMLRHWNPYIGLEKRASILRLLPIQKQTCFIHTHTQLQITPLHTKSKWGELMIHTVPVSQSQSTHKTCVMSKLFGQLITPEEYPKFRKWVHSTQNQWHSQVLLINHQTLNHPPKRK